MGKYVVVLYNGIPYPGYVEDVGIDDIYVNCMHVVGKKVENNWFFWPKKIPDKCWYLLDNLVTIIPEPSRIEKSTHYQVEARLWKEIMEKFVTGSTKKQKK